jgi:arylformamidase
MEFTLAMYLPQSNLNYFDISPVISSRTAVFPGDVPLSRDVSLHWKKGHHIELSSLQSTVHLGAHADAPSHYSSKGAGISERPLVHYLGPAQVLRVKMARGERIMPLHISHETIRAPRVLFCTGSFPNPNEWNGDFNSLSPELIQFLKEKKVITVGIDTPSVDPADSKGLETHNAILDADMAILEGLVLSEVPVGVYNLIALPLRLEGFEASPVRAILLRD